MAQGTWRVDPIENRKLQLKKEKDGGGGVDPQELRTGSRQQEIEMHKKLYGQGPGLPAGYGGQRGTEATEFRKAAAFNE